MGGLAGNGVPAGEGNGDRQVRPARVSAAPLRGDDPDGAADQAYAVTHDARTDVFVGGVILAQQTVEPESLAVVVDRQDQDGAFEGQRDLDLRSAAVFAYIDQRLEGDMGQFAARPRRQWDAIDVADEAR